MQPEKEIMSKLDQLKERSRRAEIGGGEERLAKQKAAENGGPAGRDFLVRVRGIKSGANATLDDLGPTSLLRWRRRLWLLRLWLLLAASLLLALLHVLSFVGDLHVRAEALVIFVFHFLEYADVATGEM